MEMFAADVVESPVDTALEQRKGGFNRVAVLSLLTNGCAAAATPPSEDPCIGGFSILIRGRSRFDVWLAARFT
jgi:hypothetical protein